MIVTDRFVYIHQPKTGGTFVTAMLKRLHPAGKFTRMVRKLAGKPKRPVMDIDKHARCCDIPEKFANRKVVGCIRNPYDRLVSQFEFKWWKRHPEEYNADQVRQHWPTFPEFTFEQFVKFADQYRPNVHDPRLTGQPDIGWQTAQFLEYYCRDPKKLPEIDNAYVDELRARRDLVPDIHFLHTDRLNQDLYDFLVAQGYPPNRVNFILGQGKVFPEEGGRTPEQTWEKYYTPELKAWVRQRERMIFGLFPEFDQ